MKRDVVVGASLALVVLAGVIAALVFLQSPTVDTQPIEEQTIDVTVAEEPEAEVEQPEVTAAFDTDAISAALEEWVGDLPAGAEAGVQITTVDGDVLASYQPDTEFFAASIYKLYVAYEGYRAVDAGELDPEQDYVGGNTLAECLDIMIRESDSPCAEKLWVELGKEALNTTMQEYGLTNTSMTSITTSAGDAALMLQRIATGEGLSEGAQQRLLASMKDQIYDDTFDAGFSESITVYNKIGFRELDEYHDVAIVQLEDGSQFILSAVTNGAGTNYLRGLAVLLESKLSTEL